MLMETSDSFEQSCYCERSAAICFLDIHDLQIAASLALAMTN